ncbi:MAG TPA: 50S ribosomal protein L10 [archaeon]|nr:50S ribosomal protein L10 [archaeon]
MTSHTKKWKSAKREEVAKLAKEYPFIAVATLEKLPSRIIAVLRKRLHGEATIIVAKTRVIKKALEEAGIKDEKLNTEVNKSVAVIFSKKNPFELFSFVKKNKGEAFAKTGDIADNDILVQAGDTGLPPGPALSTLKAAGLQVKMAGPTISVSADKVVTKKGDSVTKEVADVLSKLNIKPMRVGMKIIGVLDKNENCYYSGLALDVDEEELFNKFVLAYGQAFNLAVNAEYYTDATIETILIKAQREAKALNDSLNSGKEEVKVETTEVKEESKGENSEAPAQ